jgi:hypothetical protein
MARDLTPLGPRPVPDSREHFSLFEEHPITLDGFTLRARRVWSTGRLAPIHETRTRDSMNRTAMALLMLLPCAAGCNRPADLVSKECGVAFTMPARPVHEPFATDVEGSNITSHQYRTLRDGITYGFVCTPQAKPMEGIAPREALDSAKKGFLIDGDKELVTEHDLSLQSIRGRELVMKTSAYMMRNRVYLFPNGMVNIWVIGSEGDVASPAADDFFDSLRLASP